jgi:hypothetical protein
MNMLMLALLVFIVNIVLWIVLFTRFKEQVSPKTVLREIRGEFDALMRDMQGEVTRDISIITDRIQDLRAIIDEADAHILLSDTELRKREREKLIFDKMQRVTEPIEKTPTDVPTIVKSPEPIIPKKSMREQVLELAVSGLSAEFIAQKLSISITEVQLFIELAGADA